MTTKSQKQSPTNRKEVNKVNDFQRKQIEQYRQLLKQSGKYLPQEIDDMVNEKIREIEHISKLLSGGHK